jgi:hypothetical protein
VLILILEFAMLFANFFANERSCDWTTEILSDYFYTAAFDTNLRVSFTGSKVSQQASFHNIACTTQIVILGAQPSKICFPCPAKMSLNVVILERAEFTQRHLIDESPMVFCWF